MSACGFFLREIRVAVMNRIYRVSVPLFVKCPFISNVAADLKAQWLYNCAKVQFLPVLTIQFNFIYTA